MSFQKGFCVFGFFDEEGMIFMIANLIADDGADLSVGEPGMFGFFRHMSCVCKFKNKK